jgi:hypothetical protein
MADEDPINFVYARYMSDARLRDVLGRWFPNTEFSITNVCKNRA